MDAVVELEGGLGRAGMGGDVHLLRGRMVVMCGGGIEISLGTMVENGKKTQTK